MNILLSQYIDRLMMRLAGIEARKSQQAKERDEDERRTSSLCVVSAQEAPGDGGDTLDGAGVGDTGRQCYNTSQL